MREYLRGYHTTLGQRLYTCERWEHMSDADKLILLAHERVHMRQFRRFGWTAMTFLYLFVPLPMGACVFPGKV